MVEVVLVLEHHQYGIVSQNESETVLTMANLKKNSRPTYSTKPIFRRALRASVDDYALYKYPLLLLLDETSNRHNA